MELGLRGDVDDEGSGRVPRTLEVRREANSLAKGGEASRKTSMVAARFLLSFYISFFLSFSLSRERQNWKGLCYRDVAGAGAMAALGCSEQMKFREGQGECCGPKPSLLSPPRPFVAETACTE